MRKRYLSAAMAFNLGRIMRLLIGAGKPRYAMLLADKTRLALFNLLAARIFRLIHVVATETQGSRSYIDFTAPAT